VIEIGRFTYPPVGQPLTLPDDRYEEIVSLHETRDLAMVAFHRICADWLRDGSGRRVLTPTAEASIIAIAFLHQDGHTVETIRVVYEDHPLSITMRRIQRADPGRPSIHTRVTTIGKAGTPFLIRVANDRHPGEKQDAWKYKIGHGMWSPPYPTRDEMEQALKESIER
jgi:hypothetical protein